jgi:hypothetical protein
MKPRLEVAIAIAACAVVGGVAALPWLSELRPAWLVAAWRWLR